MANFCGNCGSPLKAGYKFCENCGAPVEESASAVGHANVDAAPNHSADMGANQAVGTGVAASGLNASSPTSASVAASAAAAAGVAAGRESFDDAKAGREAPVFNPGPQQNTTPRPQQAEERVVFDGTGERIAEEKTSGQGAGLPARDSGSNSDFRSFGNPGQGSPGPRYEPDTDLKSMYLRYDNRLNRKPYIIRSFHIWAVVVGLTFVVGTIATMLKIPSINMLSKVISFAAAIPNFMLLIRRLHDLNRSGWWALIMLIPLVNLLFAVYVIFFKGTKGPNKYGPDPLG